MTAVWRLKTKPQGCGDEIRKSLIAAMVKEDFIATGWHVDEIPASAAAYSELANCRYGGRAARSATRFVSQPQNGDLVWVVDLSGLYSLAKIDGPWSYKKDERLFGIYAVNRYPCSWVARGLSAADTPSGVRNALMRGPVFCRIRDKAAVLFSSKLAGTGSGDQQAPVLELIGHDALEDLVGLFLQIKTDSVLVPSSCKQSTIAYEFILKRKDGSGDIVAQVKSGNAEISDCLSDVGCDRYLFALSERYPANRDGAQIISRRDLETFLQTHKAILPATIRCWLD